MEVVVFHQLGVGKMVGMQGAVLVAGKMVGVEIAGLAQKDVVADQMVGVEGALVPDQMVADQMVGVVLVVLASLRRWDSSMEEPLSAPAAPQAPRYWWC